MKKARKENFLLGIKLVRGAYHEKETKRAQKKGYPCPVHTTKEYTDNDYNTALKICIEHINIISICAGTHNEYSSELLIKLFQQAQKFKTNLICTPECSNIITHEKKVKVLQYQVPEDKDTQLLVNFLASYYIYL